MVDSWLEIFLDFGQRGVILRLKRVPVRPLTPGELYGGKRDRFAEHAD
jgi:hypothetical protein